jgi:hypothetical protein
VESQRSVEEMVRLLSELRDALVILSSNLKDMQFEHSTAQQDVLLEEVTAALDRIRHGSERSDSP